MRSFARLTSRRCVSIGKCVMPRISANASVCRTPCKRNARSCWSLGFGEYVSMLSVAAVAA